MKVFAVVILAVCAASAAAVESVVKMERAGGNFAYSVDQAGLVPHPYMAHTPYVSPVHPGMGGRPVVAYTATHPGGPVPYGGIYGYPYGAPPVGYPYGVPIVPKPEKIE